MVNPPVLLHIGQTAVQVTMLDPAILASALLALALAAVSIWIPRSVLSLPALRRRRNRRRAAGVAATALVFLALLPSVVPYDHLFTHDAHTDAEEASAHVSHCHITPDTCSDAPVTAGPSQLLLGDALIVEPAMLTTLVATTTAVLVGITFRPDIRPPLSLAA